MPLESIFTAWPMTAAPLTVVPPSRVVLTPSDVAVSSVTIESMVTTPRRLKSLTTVRDVTVAVAPFVSVVAVVWIDPKVAKAGASAAGSEAWAFDPVGVTSTLASKPGAGLDAALGSPTPEVALTRYG